VVAQPLAVTDASRHIVLVFRHSSPRRPAMQAFADIIVDNLPNTVQRAGQRKQSRKTPARHE